MKLVVVVSLFVSVALSAQWQKGFAFFGDGTICTATKGNIMYFGGSSMHISSDSGKTFLLTQLVNKSVLVEDIVFGDNVMFVVSDGIRPGLYMSYDSGATYVRSDSLRRRMYASSYEAGRLYLLEWHTLMLSDDEGKTITEQRTVPGISRPVKMRLKNHTMYVACDDSMLVRSFDDGITWSELNDHRTRKVRDLIYDGNVLIVATKAGLLISTDKGDSFQKRFPQNDTGDIRAICLKDGMIYASDAYGSLFLSADLGLSWRNIAFRLDSAGICGIIAGPGNIAVSTYKGNVWYRPLEQVLSDVATESGATNPVSECAFRVHVNEGGSHVRCDATGMSQTGSTISIFNAVSQQLIQRYPIHSPELSQGDVEIDIQSLSNGVYMILYQSGTQTCSQLINICR